jgi:AraC family transcriptional regulator of adaptative response / DNA-3-methyladenine glycosylase II
LSLAERWRPWRAYAALHLWAAGIRHPVVSGKPHEREAA